MDNKISETREIIRIVCASNEVEIVAGHVGKDHIHLLVSVPPHLSPSKLVQYLKGNSSHKLQTEYKKLTDPPSAKADGGSVNLDDFKGKTYKVLKIQHHATQAYYTSKIPNANF